jgi:hypothetical protein
MSKAFEAWWNEHHRYQPTADKLRAEACWQAALRHAAELCRGSVCNMGHPERTEAYRLANMIERAGDGKALPE